MSRWDQKENSYPTKMHQAIDHRKYILSEDMFRLVDNHGGSEKSFQLQRLQEKKEAYDILSQLKEKLKQFRLLNQQEKENLKADQCIFFINFVTSSISCGFIYHNNQSLNKAIVFLGNNNCDIKQCISLSYDQILVPFLK